jgi:hypothetical protein
VKEDEKLKPTSKRDFDFKIYYFLFINFKKAIEIIVDLLKINQPQDEDLIDKSKLFGVCFLFSIVIENNSKST